MIGLLGKKLGMSQVFDKDGRQVPVTVIQAGPCYVTALRTQEKDGYKAVQLAFDETKEKRKSKPELGQFAKAKVKPMRFVREIRTENLEGLQLGTQLGADSFEPGDYVDVRGISIGRGFQGVVKRYHFRAGEKAHGTKMGREPGSIGASAFPSRVIKGKKLPGQMGNEAVTVQYLQIVNVDKENNLLVIKGAVPGHDNAYVVIKSALKRKKENKWKIAASEKTKQPSQESQETSSKEASEAPSREVEKDSEVKS